MDLLGKHIFITADLSYPENGIYRVLRRINRETKTQYISDAQRFLFVEEKTGKNNWKKKPIFYRTSKRFKKKILFDTGGDFTEKYGKVTIVDSNDYTAMKADVLFADLFRVVKGNGRDDLLQYDLDNFPKKLGMFGKVRRKKNKEGFTLQDVCIDTESYIGKHLKDVFGVDVYVADRIWCDKRFVGNQYCGSNHRFEYSRECDFDRNAVFHQVTGSGGDKVVISSDEDDHNSPVFLWVFDGKIVYKEQSSKSEH